METLVPLLQRSIADTGPYWGIHVPELGAVDQGNFHGRRRYVRLDRQGGRSSESYLEAEEFFLLAACLTIAQATIGKLAGAALEAELSRSAKPLRTGHRLEIDFGRMPGPRSVTVDGEEIESVVIDHVTLNWPARGGRLAEIFIGGYLYPPTCIGFTQRGAFVDEDDVDAFLAWRAERARARAAARAAAAEDGR